MPQDCNLVSYSASNAIFYSATYGQGIPPCALTVSSSGGGFITVADSNHTVLYLQPTGFKVLINAGGNDTYGAPHFAMDAEELYDVATGVVSQTAYNPIQSSATLRTLLPTINAVLSLGEPSNVYFAASDTWEPTPPLAGSDTATVFTMDVVTLFSGDALMVGYTRNSDPNGLEYLPNSQIYSPATNVWTNTGFPATARPQAAVALLHNGKVLVTGGAIPIASDFLAISATAELYDPRSRTWSSETMHLNLPCGTGAWQGGFERVISMHGQRSGHTF